MPPVPPAPGVVRASAAGHHRPPPGLLPGARAQRAVPGAAARPSPSQPGHRRSRDPASAGSGGLLPARRLQLAAETERLAYLLPESAGTEAASVSVQK